MKKLLVTVIVSMMGLQTAFAMNDQLCNKLKAEYKANGGQGEFKCQVVDADGNETFPPQRYYTKEETDQMIEETAEAIAEGFEDVLEVTGEVIEGTVHIIYEGGRFVGVSAYQLGKLVLYKGPKRIYKWLRDNAEPVNVLDFDY